ncbi:hypothetical protein [Streptomyces canus]|uniref:hypothetical protein n=1 Tax=Streptomyces canus TaxID=58343 RepID=UPI003864567A
MCLNRFVEGRPGQQSGECRGYATLGEPPGQFAPPPGHRFRVTVPARVQQGPRPPGRGDIVRVTGVHEVPQHQRQRDTRLSAQQVVGLGEPQPPPLLVRPQLPARAPGFGLRPPLAEYPGQSRLLLHPAARRPPTLHPQHRLPHQVVVADLVAAVGDERQGPQPGEELFHLVVRAVHGRPEHVHVQLAGQRAR